MMPKWLARDLILSWSNTGDTVLDPMAGSGTTGAEAVQTSARRYLDRIRGKLYPDHSPEPARHRWPRIVKSLTWHGRTYNVERVHGVIYVWRDNMTPAKASDEADAVRWLSCMSLRKGKARKLVDAELRGEGESDNDSIRPR